MSSWTTLVASSRSAGTASASRSRSATRGGSPNRGGANRSNATIARSSGSAGSRSSISTESTGRGTSSGCTTDLRRSLRSADRRADRDGEREKDCEEGDHEGDCLEVVGARGSVLHAITPEPTGPLPIVESVDGGRSHGVTGSHRIWRRHFRNPSGVAGGGDGPTRTAVRTRAPATAAGSGWTDLVSRAIS